MSVKEFDNHPIFKSIAVTSTGWLGINNKCKGKKRPDYALTKDPLTLTRVFREYFDE